MFSVIGIDIGTSTLAAALLDTQSCKSLAVQTATNTATVDDVPNGHHEQDPIAILRLIEELIDSLLEDAVTAGIELSTIRGVTVTGQMHGCLLLDAKEHAPVTNLVTWRDQRASAAISSINDARCARWGCRLQPGYGLGTLAHFLNNDRNLERCADGGAIIACGITDFVAARLCGALLTDTTMAASWGGFDVASKTWDASAMIDYGIPNDVLPDIVPPGSPLNPLTPEYARRWGLAETVQVCAGLGDNQASILAGGTLKHGTCVVNIGTGGQVSIVRRGYDYRRGLETRPLIGDYYAYVGSSLCGGWAYAYVAEFLSAAARSMTNTELSRDEVLECMNRMGQDAPSHADGLVVEPSFLGSRESGRRYGSIRHIDAQNFTPGNLIRATANGIVDELYEHHQSVGLPVTELRAAGNAVRKVAFVQHAIADRWGMRPTLTAQREEAARGAALLAASELGLVAHGSLFDNDET